MPEMNGFELCGRIRETHPMDKVAIIGLSDHGNPLLQLNISGNRKFRRLDDISFEYAQPGSLYHGPFIFGRKTRR